MLAIAEMHRDQMLPHQSLTLREDPLMPTSWPTLPRPMALPASSSPAEKVSRLPWWLRQKGTLARLSWRPGASMMQHTTVVSSSRIAYMILKKKKVVHTPFHLYLAIVF